MRLGHRVPVGIASGGKSGASGGRWIDAQAAYGSPSVNARARESVNFSDALLHVVNINKPSKFCSCGSVIFCSIKLRPPSQFQQGRAEMHTQEV